MLSKGEIHLRSGNALPVDRLLLSNWEDRLQKTATIHTPTLQRVGYLAYVPRLVGKLGGDPSKVLAEAGLRSDALSNPENAIPYLSAGRLLEAAARITGCSHFGLELGKLIGTRSLGLVGELMRNMPTLRQALTVFTENQHRNSHGGVAYLIDDGDFALFGYAVYEPNLHGSDIVSDAAGMAALHLVCELATVEIESDMDVRLSRPQPDDWTPYEEALGAGVRFDDEQTAVILPRSLMDQPVQGARPVLVPDLRLRVQGLWTAGDLDIETRVRRQLRVAFLTGRFSGTDIARQLGMSRRTLHRRLEDVGLHFQNVLDQTRLQFTQQLLAHTQLSVSSISKITGYSKPSVLTRSFGRWVGSTPSEWRAKQQTQEQGTMSVENLN